MSTPFFPPLIPVTNVVADAVVVDSVTVSDESVQSSKDFDFELLEQRIHTITVIQTLSLERQWRQTEMLQSQRQEIALLRQQLQKQTEMLNAIVAAVTRKRTFEETTSVK
jgi:hypothetical protein